MIDVGATIYYQLKKILNVILPQNTNLSKEAQGELENIPQLETLKKEARELEREATKIRLEKIKGVYGKQKEAMFHKTTPREREINEKLLALYDEIKLFKKTEQLIKQEPFKVDLNTAPIAEIKKEFLPRLKPLFNQELVSQSGEKAYFNLKSLSKMLSDKAINKSVDNGFSREQHLRAVSEIKNLFEKAKLAETQKDLKNGKSDILIHRFNSEFENANALITTKESLDKNKNRIYSVELELSPLFSDKAPRLDKDNIKQGQPLLTQATSGKS